MLLCAHDHMEGGSAMTVMLTVTMGDCRCGHVQEGDHFLAEDLCPPLCHELWKVPYVFALRNGGGRVCVPGELMEL